MTETPDNPTSRYSQNEAPSLKTNVEELEVVTERNFGTNAMASPAISGDRMFLRVAEDTDSGRQESLVCLQK